MPHCLSLVPTTCTVITQEKPGYESWETIENFTPGMKKRLFLFRHEKKGGFMPGMKKKKPIIFMLDMEKGGFHARHEKRRFSCIHTYIHTYQCSLARTMYVCLHSGDTHLPARRKIRICAFQSTPRIRTHDILKNFNPSLWGQIPIVLVGTFLNLSFNINIVWTHIYFYFKR